jgi:hypothetical protein
MGVMTRGRWTTLKKMKVMVVPMKGVGIGIVVVRILVIVVVVVVVVATVVVVVVVVIVGVVAVVVWRGMVGWFRTSFQKIIFLRDTGRRRIGCWRSVYVCGCLSKKVASRELGRGCLPWMGSTRVMRCAG